MKPLDLQRKDAALNKRLAELRTSIAKVSSSILTSRSSEISRLVTKRIQLEHEEATVLKTISEIRRAMRPRDHETKRKAEAERKLRLWEHFKAKVAKGEITCPRCGCADQVGIVEAQSTPIETILYVESKSGWLANLRCTRCELRFENWVEPPQESPKKESPKPMVYTFPPGASRAVIHESESASTMPLRTFANKKDGER
mgnify:CR=1 FL=1